MARFRRWLMRLNLRRLIGAFLFLAVSFLPFHVHAANECSQVRQECYCHSGGRPELGSPPATVAPIRICEFVIVISRRIEIPTVSTAASEPARGPPILLPLLFDV